MPHTTPDPSATPRRVLITGGAGFIGSHLVERCLEGGAEVTVLDDFSTGRRENLDGLDCTIVTGDLRDAAVVRTALKGVDAVLHHAAIPSVPKSVEEPVATAAVNVLGTVTLLDECVRAGVRRLVFASSSAVYGEPESVPLSETSPTRPLSPYGAHKLSGEQLCRIAAETHAIDTVSFRYFNVFGPRQRADSDYAAAIPIFHTKCAAGEVPTIYGDGSQTRDFVHVSDVAEANWRALLRSEPFDGAVFNVARGEATRIEELARTILELHGSDASPHLAPPRPGDIVHSVASIDALARAFGGWSPEVSIRQGLERALA